jgi:hypothetical protein
MNNLVEKYIIIEIFEKLYRLKSFINSNRSILKDAGKEITLNVFEIAFNKILEELETPIQIINNNDLSGEARQSLNRRLSTTLNLFKDFHSLLRFIHSDWVRPETYTFSNCITKNLPKEYVNTQINIILIDEYSFKENNLINKFNKVFRKSRILIDNTPTKYPTIFLPKLEICNPLNWTILAHEIGHINEQEIKKITEDPTIIPPQTTIINEGILKKWAEEIFCDIFATNLLGPAYFSSLVSYSLCTGSLAWNSFHSQYHPSNMLRIRFLYEYLERNRFSLKCNSAMIGEEDLSTFFFNMIEDIDKINLGMHTDPNITNIKIPNLTHFLDRLRELTNTYTTQIKYQSENKILDLNKKLVAGIPIGAIRENSTEKILDSLKGEIIDFEISKRLISERATTLWEILNTGWVYKISTIIPECSKIIFEENDKCLYDKIPRVGELYNLCDDRILKSIEASALLQLIEKTEA